MLHGKYTLFIDQYGNRWEARTVSELRDSIGGGHHIGLYTIQEIKPGYVKIGCHKIPMQNIRELYSALIEDAAE